MIVVNKVWRLLECVQTMLRNCFRQYPPSSAAPYPMSEAPYPTSGTPYPPYGAPVSDLKYGPLYIHLHPASLAASSQRDIEAPL